MNYRLKKLLVQERKKEKANSQIKMKNNVFTTYILNTLASRERGKVSIHLSLGKRQKRDRELSM